MRHNLTELIREQFINQFENVVRDEIRRHNVALKKTDDSISDLIKSLQALKKDHEDLKSKTESLYLDTQKRFALEYENLEEAFADQRSFIKNSFKKNQTTSKKLEQQINNLVDVDDFVEYKSTLSTNLLSFDQKLNDASQEIDKKYYKFCRDVEKSLEEIEYRCQKRGADVLELISNLRTNLNAYSIDSLGILKELQVYKKTVFVMEKKIENLYTLIERLNKRIEECPRQD